MKLSYDGKVKVLPLAAESLGVRSLAVHIKTPDVQVLIDPGVALGFRDGYHPHPNEYKLLAEYRKKNHEKAQTTDLIVVSHYHHDHYMPFFTNFAYFWSTRYDANNLYQNRRVWCKDIRTNINYSQQRRGYNFMRGARKVAQEVVYADGRALKIGDTTIRFSPAVPHGEEGTKLGWVIMTVLRYQDVTILHGSDIQGPMVKSTADWIMKQNPTFLMLAGPPTYLAPDRVNSKVLDRAAKNLKLLVACIPTIIVDHHLLRDQHWREWLNPLQEFALEKDHQVITVSEALGQSVNLLEANRVDLYSQYPASLDYEKWVKQIQRSRIAVPPPLDN